MISHFKLYLLLGCVVSTAAAESQAPETSSPTANSFQASKGVCGNGSTTLLEYENSSPRHSRFVLRSRLANEVLFHKDFNESYSCWGYSNALRAYILAGQWEKGSSPRLQSITYLYEAGLNRLKPSIFDKKGYWAVASVLSPDSDVMAFIGGPANQTTAALYVMDFAKNKIQKLGQPPAPPPVSEGMTEEAWGWNHPTTSYQPLDKGILYFSKSNILVASYGQDTAQTRASARQTKSWIIR